jgi:hypothetical protein
MLADYVVENSDSYYFFFQAETRRITGLVAYGNGSGTISLSPNFIS